MTKTNDDSSPLVIERSFKAPRALVWRAISEPEGMRRWYFDLAEFRPEVGFEFEFTVEHEGFTYRHLCKVTAAVPMERLAYTWRYDGHEGDSLVTFELSDAPEGTHVRLTHEGLNTFPRLPAFARKNFEAGWTDLVGSRLADYVENADREIVMVREFNAPRHLVWEAMSKPEHVANWWGPRGFVTTIETMDFRVGGAWKLTMQGPDGMKFPNKSIFREIVDQERIVFSHGGGREDGGAPGANFIATWSFDALTPERTRVTARLVFATPESRDLVVREYNAVEGGKQTLMRLGEHLAGALSEPFVISREFNAPRDLVWKAWTERDRFMRWFGPKGCTMPDATMDFRVGGELLYRLRTPDGGEMWAKWIFREIVEPEKITFTNSFSDETGAIKPNPFPGEWPLQMITEVRFVENNGKTLITLKWLPLDATVAERKTFDDHRGSFTQGWTGTFEQLEAYLGTQVG